MAFVRCELPHPLFIILTPRCLEKAAADYPGLIFPQNAAEVEADFVEAAERGVLVLVDEKQPDNPKLSFCTPRYELVCGLTQQKDAWFAIRLAPLGLRTHHQLARGALEVVPQTWGLVSDLAEFNQELVASLPPTGVEQLLAAWKGIRQPAPPRASSISAGNSAAELSFLANLETLIDLACEVELEQAARQEKVLVRVGEALSAVKWRFHSSTPVNWRVGEYLRAGRGSSAGDLEGVVVEALGNSLVLRFFQPPEAGQIQKIEWLVPKISTKQYAIQHAAVRALRNGESLNPHLLGLIVESQFADYPVPNPTGGAGRLNRAQTNLLERALVVPDLLLALGPPGTGKTETLRAIVAREAALGRRVLITSKNNKAVDNVLEGLTGVHALRIGREEAVDPSVRPLLIDQRASALQAGILTNLQPVEQSLAAGLEHWAQIQAALARLSELTTAWQAAQAALDRELELVTGWQTAAFLQVERALQRQQRQARQLSARLDELWQVATELGGRVERLQRFSHWPLIGGLAILLADQFAQDWQAAAGEYRQTVQAIRQLHEKMRQVWQAYYEFVTGSEQALQFKRRAAEAEAALEVAQAESARGLAALTHLSQVLPGFPVPPQTLSQEGLAAFFDACQEWHVQQTRRQALLGEWRDLIQTSPQTLYPTLIRSADVVGATCIGVATDARFEDLEFDLVLADEAGQIQAMDLLVPLVRARRAVLVGDHLQLPPLVETEIVAKIRENEPENQELGLWLEKSLFERLIAHPETPASHKIMLDTQYRMPRQIADLISAQFYSGQYQTGRDVPHTDPFFSGSPLVFVDTFKETRHFEQRATDGQGYFNPTEARLIADLALAYQAQGIEVGVIVPYKQQAEFIRRELRQRQAGWCEADLFSRVATVDSFQGREQEVILFGFTRSNADGRIGFLAELRRLNVSLTRARRQLILVGDSVTLTSTPDAAFAQLAQALLTSAKSTPKGYFAANELARRLQS